MNVRDGEWKKTACILCECNCGIEVQIEEGQLVRFRGDKDHPASAGYACEKPHRLNYYQHNKDRLSSPMRRRPDGSFEAISWDTAISEVAEKLRSVRDTYGEETLFYYGGGGQGNHFPGMYASATRRALGIRNRSNALAQEKTGEAWIASRMMGGYTRADFENCDVGFFLGKNPWQSHSIHRARVVLREISKDPNRTLIVVDPRRTESAELADIHLQVRPGTDAYLLAAMLKIMVEEGLVDQEFVANRTVGSEEAMAAILAVDVAKYCERTGVEQELVTKAAIAMGKAKSLASFEDLGVQMSRHSTVVSYLNRLFWILTGNFGKPGGQYIPTQIGSPFGNINKITKSPVLGALTVGGLIPCNVIAEEILADHPKRYRAMIVEAVNPAHSLADSKRFREAFERLDALVVIDVAMTETAKLADYVLPASSQFEKAEATFFNLDFPKNYFHLRPAIFPPAKGTLPEAEIHSRLCEALGAISMEELQPLVEAAKQGLESYVQAFMTMVTPNPKLSSMAPVIAYRTLGPALPEGLQEGAPLLGVAMQAAMKHGGSLARAGLSGPPVKVAIMLFEKMINSPSGFIFAIDEWEENWASIRTKDKKFHLGLSDILEAVNQLGLEEPEKDDAFPFVLCAGERRSFSANTIIRAPEWRKKDIDGALRISPGDASRYQVDTGDTVKLTTKRGSAMVAVEVTDTMQDGHIAIPNGFGLGYDGNTRGVAPNELTSIEDRDPFSDIPRHKYVRANIEKRP